MSGSNKIRLSASPHHLKNVTKTIQDLEDTENAMTNKVGDLRSYIAYLKRLLQDLTYEGHDE